MLQTIYKVIYSKNINFVLRNINKFLSPLLPKKIKIPPSGTIKIRNSFGEKLKISLNQTSGFGQVIFWGDYRKFEYTSIFIVLIKKINTFYDIGANIGYYSVLAASENKEISVVSFEPATGPLFFCKQNIRINDLDNVKVESIALSDKKGIIEFHEVKNRKYKYLEHCLSGESNTGSLTTGRNFEIIKVPTITLDDYVEQNEEKNIDLIKIDTEGTEHYILSHASTVLEEMKPIIICETLFNVIEDKLESVLSTYGYEFYNHTDEGLKKVTTITRSKDNGVRNCFFVHPDKHHLIEEFVV